MIYFLFVVALVAGANAHSEFGLLRKLRNQNINDNDDVTRGLLELERSFLVNFSISMSMSLSMSFVYAVPTSTPVLSPNKEFVTVAPFATPTSFSPVSTPIVTMSPAGVSSLVPTPETPSSITTPTSETLAPSIPVIAAPTVVDLQPLTSVDGENEFSKKSNRWILGTCLGVMGGVILAMMAVVTKKRLDHLADANKKELQDGESSAETSIDHGDMLPEGTTTPEIATDNVVNV